VKAKKSVALVLLALCLTALVLWLWGRAPTDFVLQAECLRFQNDRRLRDAELAEAIARGGPPELRDQRQEAYRALRRLHLRGWEVVLLPMTAERPAPRDFLVIGEFDAASERDPPYLRGAIEVWVAPRDWLARTLHSLGLTP